MTVLESYAACTPVVGAAIGGVPEMVAPDTHGALFEAGNASALADRLAEYAGMSDAKLAMLCQGVRDWVEAQYTPQSYYRAMQDVYGGVRYA